MEAAGLVVGSLSLAGLFNACLEAIDRFDSWRNFGSDLHFLGVRLEAEKLRFEKWGQAVGFQEGRLSSNHHEALDDPRTKSAIERLLSAIKDICSNADDAFALMSGADSGYFKNGYPRHHLRFQPSISPESSRQKLKWALRDKAKCTAQVKMVGQLVQDLYNLVSPDGAVAAANPNDASADGKSWAGEFQRILLRIESEIEADTRNNLHAWLMGRYVPNELYENALRKRLNGTCDWILTQPCFLDWVAPDFPGETPKYLWINGPAGFGKTVLCARVIEYLSCTLDLPVARFFISSDLDSSRDPLVAIRSWLSQLIISHPAAFEMVLERRRTQHCQAATRADVLGAFREVIQAIPGCTFIVDGLDECAWMGENGNVDDNGSVAAFLEAIKGAAADTTTRIMITSRDEPEIRQGIVGNMSSNIFEHKISSEDLRADTALYSRSIVNRRLHNKGETLKEDISQKLAARCNGQFLWLKLQEPSLRSWKNKKQLQTAIDKTPTGLNHLYDRSWERILGLPEEERTRAFALLRWVTFAVRPLTVTEITEALLIDDDCDELSVDEIPDCINADYLNSEILDICGSLIEVRGTASNIGSRTVHITHFSVKQYFIHRMSNSENGLETNEPLRSFGEAVHHVILARMCLRYVNMRSAWEEIFQPETNQVLRRFQDYAAGSWYVHAKMGGPNDAETLRLSKVLFDANNPNWDSWRRWFDETYETFEGAELTQGARVSPLYYASRLGLAELVDHLIRRRKYSVNEKTGSGRTILEASCMGGNLQVVKLLLEAGADPLLSSGDRRGPLITASTRGDVEIVKLLLDKRADVALVAGNEQMSLWAASERGHIEVVKLLRQNGANIETADTFGLTPLGVASLRGHTELVQLLLKWGANTTSADVYNRTSLHRATIHGHVEVVKVLLQWNANTMARDNRNRTPLRGASAGGHVEVAKLLLKQGAVIAARDDEGQTALHMASLNGHVEVVRLLLEQGADIAVMEKLGSTPLHIASFHGHVEVVKYLVEQGADASATDKVGGTALHEASFQGHAEVVEFLLEKDAAVTLMEDNYGRIPLTWAAIGGSESATALHLAANKVDPDWHDRYGQTPLSFAARAGKEGVVRVLLSTEKVDPHLEDGFGRTPAWWARRCGFVDIENILSPKDESIGPNGSAIPGASTQSVKDSSDRVCDVCWLDFQVGDLFHCCRTCYDFDVCEDCFSVGARCLDDRHDLWASRDGRNAVSS